MNIIIRDVETINVSENQFENEISIYPNPAADYFIVKLNGIKADRIEIYNCLGKRVLNTAILIDNQEVFINSLPNGVYFLKVNNANGIVAYKKFVKSK